MAPRLTVISWRDIPAQVTARDGRRAGRAMLGLRFQVAIDRAATRAGKKKMDDYLAEWRRTDRECGPDLDAEVRAEVARLEARYTNRDLAALVAGHGKAPAGSDDPATRGGDAAPRRRGGRQRRTERPEETAASPAPGDEPDTTSEAP
jgi:hypothetical protein